MFPARAGVILVGMNIMPDFPDVPRASGGDPMLEEEGTHE